jgi:hypothetical protein
LQQKTLEAQKKLQSVYDIEQRRNALEAQIPKLEELYRWGHKKRSEYLADYNAIKRELQQLTPIGEKVLGKLASFIKNVTNAWDQASQEQKNRLAKCLLETVWIKDKKVVAVTPQPEFTPFFDLQYDGKSNYTLVVRPRGDLNPRSPP